MILLSQNPFYQALVGGLAAVLTFLLFCGITFIFSLIKRKRNRQENLKSTTDDRQTKLDNPSWFKRFKKTLWWFFIIACCIAVAIISVCVFDVDSWWGDDKGSNESTEYIVSNEVKTITLKPDGQEYLIYKDYYWKHKICLEENLISFHSYYGAGNGWKPDYMLGDEYDDPNLGIKDWGKVSNIEEINDSTIHYDCIETVTNLGTKQYNWCLRYEDNSKYHSYPYALCYSSIDFKPLHGYEVAFRIGEERDIKRLRIYPTKYILDNEDKLKSVTLQYQLF